MTHDELCKIGAKFLKSIGCSIIAIEPSSMCNEKPDVIGWNGATSFLLEAKISRSDFLRDKKKPFRINSAFGMGDIRLYIAPEGLVKFEELSERWGLVEVNKSGGINSVQGFPSWNRHTHTGNKRNENLILLSLLRKKYDAPTDA
jgi:hypothetical protein